MILHLVENENFILEYKQLEKIVGCIASSFFYDKLDIGLNKDILNRQISVIIINEKFEVLRELEKIKNFEDYSEKITKFLEDKLNEIKIFQNILKGNSNFYKYLSCKIKMLGDERKKLKFITCDLIITEINLIFLEYKNNKFELIMNVDIKNLRKLAFSKSATNCILLYDNKELFQGIEIKTESYISLLTLLDDLFHSYPENLKN